MTPHSGMSCPDGGQQSGTCGRCSNQQANKRFAGGNHARVVRARPDRTMPRRYSGSDTRRRGFDFQHSNERNDTLPAMPLVVCSSKWAIYRHRGEMKKHHAYTVKWRDSSTLRGWRSIDDGAHEVATITSVGWLIRSTSKTVTITSSISECGNVADSLSIPRESIMKMTKLQNYVAGN